MSECASKGCGCSAGPTIQPTAPAPLTTESAQAVYRIENMDCPTEEALIRSKLAGLPGVIELDFNLMQRTLTVQHELVLNIVVLWNTIYMEAALDQLRQEGFPVRDEDVSRLSPLTHDHINMHGRYSFAVSEAVARGELRPLRNPDDTEGD